MKKSFITGPLVITFFALLSSCKKDYPSHGNGHADLKICNIQRITTITNPTDSLVFDFSYNQKGNPVLLTSNKTQQGLYNVHFRYDQQHRLTAYYAEPLPGQPIDFQYLHKFTHDNKGRPVIDSNYLGGTFAAVNNGTQDPIQIVHFEYDHHNRIKKATEINYPGSSAESQNINIYTYDANGNLVKDGVTYDDKLNWARTNSTWMFIRRDYSVNNPFTATSYNPFKLPVTINEPQTPYSIFVYPVYYGHSKVVYQCDVNGQW